MNIENVLNKIIDTQAGATFYRITNAEGKTWLMPARHMQTAMELYQPSGRNGKLLKKWLPWVKGMEMVRKRLHIAKCRLRLKDDIQALIGKSFGLNDFEYSFFLGTPCPRQKITVQIFQGQRILGYVKFTESKNVEGLFLHEEGILNSLHRRGVDNVPKVMFCGSMGGLYMFMQTTSKTKHSTTLHEWSALHSECLRNIIQKTTQDIGFKETDYYRFIISQKDSICRFEEKNRKALERGLDIVCRHYGNIRGYCFFHGDLTPWNCYIEGGRLYLFDLEYASMTFPPYLDMIHFVMQIDILVKHLDAGQIILHLQEGILEKEMGNGCKEAIIAYLLFILFFYMDFFDTFDSQDNGYRVWTSLLDYYVKQYDTKNNSPLLDERRPLSKGHPEMLG